MGAQKERVSGRGGTPLIMFNEAHSLSSLKGPPRISTYSLKGSFREPAAGFTGYRLCRRPIQHSTNRCLDTVCIGFLGQLCWSDYWMDSVINRMQQFHNEEWHSDLEVNILSNLASIIARFNSSDGTASVETQIG